MYCLQLPIRQVRSNVVTAKREIFNFISIKPMIWNWYICERVNVILQTNNEARWMGRNCVYVFMNLIQSTSTLKLLCNPLLIKQANSVQIKLLSCKSIVYCATTMLYNTTKWLIQRDPQNQWNEREKKKGIKSTEQWQDFITRFLNSESATSYTQYSQCIFISYSLCSFAVQWVILLILMEEKIPSKS